MRFADVHNQEGNAVTVLFVELVEGGSLPPEWRSSITAEDQYNGLALVQFRDADISAFVHLE